MLNMSCLAFVPMTKTVTIAAILALSAGLLFAVPMAVEAAGEWKDLSDASKNAKGNSLKLTVTADDVITKDGSMFDDTTDKVVLGYAWVEGVVKDGKQNAFVTALHPLFRDSNQNPDAWHSHSVKLRSVGGANFCLAVSDIGTTQAGISIKGNTMTVSTPLKQSGVDVDDLAVATSFTIQDPEHSATSNNCNVDELLVRANSIARSTTAGL